ncbi:hypothetical protein [Nocardioides piscis]|uniref:Uncharacterized protein n=1 Tax=Nocardioides piscis TaxID=2714938 RepID=A0A6G7YEN9_9ACTN|nr:hypothetical protein [Nocardioides piscis]QIK75230.1 hypothetical protein G7071_07110 [Nocardioides piscis]
MQHHQVAGSRRYGTLRDDRRQVVEQLVDAVAVDVAGCPEPDLDLERGRIAPFTGGNRQSAQARSTAEAICGSTSNAMSTPRARTVRRVTPSLSTRQP